MKTVYLLKSSLSDDKIALSKTVANLYCKMHPGTKLVKVQALTKKAAALRLGCTVRFEAEPISGGSKKLKLTEEAQYFGHCFFHSNGKLDLRCNVDFEEPVSKKRRTHSANAYAPDSIGPDSNGIYYVNTWLATTDEQTLDAYLAKAHQLLAEYNAKQA